MRPCRHLERVKRGNDLTAHQVYVFQHLGLRHLRVEHTNGHVGEAHLVVNSYLLNALIGAPD